MKKTAEKRLTAIQKYLLDHGKATVKELSSILQVTPEMIRKDLSFLEEKGFLFRTHGGAMLRNSNIDVPISIRCKEKINLKKLLCSKAIDLIHDEDCVFVDPSSTLLHLGNLIRLRKNLTIVTNCFDFLNTARNSNQTIFFLGGKYSLTGNRTEGQFQLSMIEKFRFDIAFFGSDGVMGLDGPGTQSNDAIFLNEAVLANSKTKVLVLDSSKFTLSSRYRYAKFTDFDVLITDHLPNELHQTIPIETIYELGESV